MPEDILLFGSQTLIPLVPTVYNLIPAPDATNSSNNSEVYLNFDCNNASVIVNLPSANSYNGKWNLILYFRRMDISGNNLDIYRAATDVVCGSLGVPAGYPFQINTLSCCELRIIGNNYWIIS